MCNMTKGQRCLESLHTFYTQTCQQGSTDTPGMIPTRPQLVPWRVLVVIYAHTDSIEYLCARLKAHSGWDGAGIMMQW